MSWPGSASITISLVHTRTFRLLTLKGSLIIKAAFLFFCNLKPILHHIYLNGDLFCATVVLSIAVLFSRSYTGVVVERIDSCASMYSRSIQGHHVCLLVKTVSVPSLDPVHLCKNTATNCFCLVFLNLQSGQTVSIDAKCDEPTLLGNVLDEIKQTFSQC